MTRKVLITGSAGFIGFHLAMLLLKKGVSVVGIDSISDYYDPRIKERRLEMLREYPDFTFHQLDIATFEDLYTVVERESPDELVHLAAQAGVRYSLVNPWAYEHANYLGTLNVFEVAKQLKLPRVIYASSSSVYGANKKSPFSEEDRVDTPISLYAASKKANEVLAYSYHHLYGIECIGLRFFTVYGQWGRPDMALFKFVRRIVAGQPIQVYNNGEMKRSFTHVTDIVSAIDTILSAAPAGAYELYNLGGSEVVPLMELIHTIENSLTMKASIEFLPLQAGDVAETVADCSKAAERLGYTARTGIQEGVRDFVNWFMEHRSFLESLSEPKQ